MRVKAKCEYFIRLHSYGEFEGMTFDIKITKDMRFEAERKNNYYFLTRNKFPTIRLTPAAFRRLFVVTEV